MARIPALVLRREFYEAMRRPVRIIGIPRQTRARWWLAHRVDHAAIWLSGHGRHRAAILLWRIFRLW